MLIACEVDSFGKNVNIEIDIKIRFYNAIKIV